MTATRRWDFTEIAPGDTHFFVFEADPLKFWTRVRLAAFREGKRLQAKFSTHRVEGGIEVSRASETVEA